MKRLLYLLTMALFFALATATLEAKSYSYSQIHSMPMSIEKDYYIWRFLNQKSTTARQAKAIIQESNHLNKKLRKSYYKKTHQVAKLTKASRRNKHQRVSTKADREAWLASKRGVSFKAYRNKAIKAIVNKNETLAVAYYQKARALARNRLQADEATFWLYLLTKKKSHYRQLLKSSDLNLYTLTVRDMAHMKYPRTFTPKLPKKDLSHYNEKNPIHWAKIKNKIFNSNTNLKSFANNYKAQESIGVYSYIRTKATKQKEIYYPMPYRTQLTRFSKRKQALIYAIARQESRFVPASVSSSFALGMMQIMPFLIDHIAKERKEKLDYDQMFNPKVAIIYANHHLNYLTSYLYSPLFIAYAYNGGIGFTKRLIKDRSYFRPGRYEPYLSMEKISNVEAREYGKKVLVNFVIYLNKLGVPTRITPIIKQLTNPAKTDKFRE